MSKPTVVSGTRRFSALLSGWKTDKLAPQKCPHCGLGTKPVDGKPYVLCSGCGEKHEYK